MITRIGITPMHNSPVARISFSLNDEQVQRLERFGEKFFTDYDGPDITKDELYPVWQDATRALSYQGGGFISDADAIYAEIEVTVKEYLGESGDKPA